MSFEVLIKQIEGIIEKASDEKTLAELGTEMFVELQAEYKKRIFEDGLNSKAGGIGKYSTTPGYYSQTQFVRKGAFKPKGKTSTGNFKNGSPRKTMFLQGGYTEFRNRQGRKTEKKTFKLSGSLEAGFAIIQDGDAVVFGQTSQFEAKKMESLELQSGRVFTLTEDEKEFIGERIAEGYAVLVLNDD